MSPLYRSFAKVNVHLQVVGRRADGFHELRTLYQTVADHDLVRVDLTASEVRLSVREGDVEAGEGNLALRAARAFLARWKPAFGVRIELFKRLPIGGGLGGGSSNAATVLLALAELSGLRIQAGELWKVARELGADVPYFLVGGTALGVGRGDEVVVLPEWPEEALWLVTPPDVVSTRSVFSELGPEFTTEVAPELLGLLAGQQTARLSDFRGRNDLADVVFARYPQVASVYNALLEAGAELVGLSGSGSTVFACFAGEEPPSFLRGRLPAGSRVVRTTTISRADSEARRIVEERGTTNDGDYRGQGFSDQ